LDLAERDRAIRFGGLLIVFAGFGHMIPPTEAPFDNSITLALAVALPRMARNPRREDIRSLLL
ncbi:MAG: hypothetical protein JWR79_1973, partial [Tardiphaga sp.]|nr:hypothetical protein [Tardiphaga sp.]